MMSSICDDPDGDKLIYELSNAEGRLRAPPEGRSA
jgi:hypothetical protein